MPRMPLGLLSFGVFVIIVAIAIVVSVQLGWNFDTSLALIIALYGCWTIALSGIRVKNPEKYARTPFSIFGWGLLLVAVGSAWFIYSLNPVTNWLLSVVLLLVVIGALALVSALRGFKK